MAAEPSRRHFGGQTAVQGLLGATTRPVRASDARRQDGRRFRVPAARRTVPVALGSVTLAILAVTGARAVEGSAPAQAAAVARAPAHVAAPARMTIPTAAPAAAQEGEARFTGRVGADLTASLKAAGVPERQGREYVWLLGKAFNLADGLSVEDKFDLIILRDDNGQPGQLV